MNATTFSRQVAAMSNRLSDLYQGISASTTLSPALLPSALKELGIASERLQVAADLLSEQNQQLLLASQSAATERQRYQELLEFIPDACLITDAAGVVQQANQAATKLLNLPPSFLTGRLLTAFVPPEARLQFQTELQRLQQRPWKHEWQVQLQPYQGTTFNASILVEVSQPDANQPPMLRWLLRYLSDRQPSDHSPNLSYPLRTYHKGETIPLSLQGIWQVHSGLVQLTTFSQTGQEILIGLAGASAPFGPSLTALTLYEATALADTQLWCIPLTDFAASSELQQRLLPQISQRLKQTELLLTVYGQLRVSDRLYTLLQLLKQEVGQSVTGGTRLSVRLTHEDLAIACGTTRVTITRLLRQFQQQQKLRVDSQHHLILLEGDSSSPVSALSLEQVASTKGQSLFVTQGV
ncbi:helix-turn-helix domain-containing protein [Trichocoleus sp. FACHB-262]|uniref:helix-turn-helix domain-containing protein n=1 Tax=Trichocoleus sp. FACHB-262 TaxID=2692869 RepID=UPI001685A2FD|nr:helix-turn-helix domain-containing protein [Trichocoleus sp. FACHB-262]MBD2123556.1 PAS domain-containing protein [Trichocoleus sp. FACHB-262]